MKVFCPKCCQVFTPSFVSMPEDRCITGEEFTCECCGVRLKQFPRGTYQKHLQGYDNDLSFAFIGRGIAVGIFLVIIPIIIWGITGNGYFGVFSLTVAILFPTIALANSFYQQAKKPLFAELYED